MADREFNNNPAHNLPGFSSNSNWADINAQWSHHPVEEGPKEGFHDPVEPEPVRQQIWNGGN